MGALFYSACYMQLHFSITATDDDDNMYVCMYYYYYYFSDGKEDFGLNTIMSR